MSLIALLISFTWLLSDARAQQIWEYSPYRIELWLRLDPSLNLTAQEEARLSKHLNDRLAAVFGPAWRLHLTVPSQDMNSLMRRGLDNLTVEDMTAGEFVLLLAKDSEEAKSYRTFDAAIDRVKSIAISKHDRDLFKSAAEALPEPDKNVGLILEKTTDEQPDLNTLAARIEQKAVSAALVRRFELSLFEKTTRQLNTTLPWQTDRLYRELDKVFFVDVGFNGDSFVARSRELDCTIRHFGPTISRTTANYPELTNCMVDAVVASFAPTARVEEAETRSAKLIMRAGGLILDDLNPARIQAGDVLQPALRREDRNGVPTMLQVLPWTFVAITASDGIVMQANTYSGIGNPLGGKVNKRILRIAMRVRPTSNKSDIKLVERMARNQTETPRIQVGSAFYERDLADEELKFLGRTDWRGIYTMTVPDRPLAVLPEAERKRRAEAKRILEAQKAEEAAKKAEAESKAHKDEDGKSSSASSGSESAPSGATTGATKSSTSAASSESSPANSNRPTEGATPAAGEQPATGSPEAPAPIDDSKPVPLRQPLVQVYVKSGDTLLAKLPLVPGLSPLELAEIPNDDRRLEAEGLVRGYQAELLDLIGSRALLTARIRARISERKFTDAENLIAELRSIKNYAEITAELTRIQGRTTEDTSREPIPMQFKGKFDLLFRDVRQIIKDHLQKDIAAQLQEELDKAKNSPADGSTEPAADAASSPKST